MSWLQHPVILENAMVKLVPLEAGHIDPLLKIAQSPEIWTFMTFDGLDSEKLKTELRSAMVRRMNGEEYAFTVFDKQEDRIIGSTRMYNIYSNHRKLEIGWTWYDPAYWGRGYNAACKLLLLEYCFEKLNCVRVQFQVNEENKRSCAAVQKIGATQEGILRNERTRSNGTIRNTVMFSIIDSEWPGVKAVLTKQLPYSPPTASTSQL